MKVLIAGGSGFVGTQLRRYLMSQYIEVYILTTQPNLADNQFVFYWNPRKKICNLPASIEFDTMINLCGANIADKLWTSKRKQELIDSRTQPIQYLRELMQSDKLRIRYIVQASAIGYYGSTDRELKNEESSKGSGYLAEICDQWEAASTYDCPTSILRIGIVFAPESGAFPKLVQGLRFRVMPLFGRGDQIISWIDISDLCRLIHWLITNQKKGVYNAVNSSPIENLRLLKKFQKYIGGTSLPLPIPERLIQILLGDFSELLLSSQNIQVSKAVSEGFEFQVDKFSSFLKKYKSYWR